MENIYEELFSDYRWMDGVDNLEKFKSNLEVVILGRNMGY